jgi:hypothetical protein
VSILSPDDKDISRISDAASEVISAAIKQAAEVLVPAIGAALGNAAGGVKITINIPPIQINLSTKE